MSTPHTHCKKGTRIKIILNNGETFIDKFVDHKSRYIHFENHKVETKDIRAFAIYKGDTNAVS